MATVVYRVEDTAGVGPYVIDMDEAVFGNNELHRQLTRTLEAHIDTMPAPYQDGIPKPKWHIGYGDKHEHGWRCGFASQESLHAWFTLSDLHALRKARYVISTYNAERVYLGKHQCIFFRPTSTLVTQSVP